MDKPVRKCRYISRFVFLMIYDGDRRKVMSRGFNGYLSKPLNKDELLKMLHKMGI